MARLPNFLVIIRSEKLSGKGQGRGCLGVRKKERFVLGKRTFRSQKSKHFVLRIIEGSNYKTYLGKKIIGIQEFPRDPVTFRVEDQINFDSRDDATVANLCLRKALAFKQEFKNKDADENSKMQIAVLDYLLFRFMNNSVRRYISTQELQNDLERKGFERLSTQSFRNRIIAKLRDHGVIIASSNKGYKLPSKKSEVEDFIKKTQGIIEPMLHRLKLCYNAIRLGSNGTIFMLDDPEYSTLKKLIEVE